MRPIHILLLAVLLPACTEYVAQDEANQKVRQLLSQMTLEEKVGQMTQITIGSLSNKNVERGYNDPIFLDSAKLKQFIVGHKIGSVLNTGAFAHTREQWHFLIGQLQEMATQETRLGIPLIYGIDAIHGTNYTQGSTLYPQQIGLAATWNTSLVKQLAEMTAYETAASGIPWTFSPVLDLGIDPRWPRMWEGFGEDPFLVSQMGVAMQSGFQGDSISHPNRVAACLKHYIGYGAPRSGKDRTPAWIPERMMREYFVPPFAAAIKAGAKSIMVNSGEVNGLPIHANYDVLTTLLRDELGFKGLLVTDWYDIYNLVERHHIAKDKKEATKLAINAGIDMAMVPYDDEFTISLIELVEKGEVPMSRIDEAVGRILSLKMESGLFEKPITEPTEYPDFGSKKHSLLAKEAAQESIILLKNEDSILPLSKDTKVLVCGPNANSMRTLNGGWSYNWQGNVADHFAQEKNTILEAIVGKIGADNVLFEEGVRYPARGQYWKDEMLDLAAISDAARSADVILACIGENSYTEKQGDLNSLMLSDNQKILVQTLQKTGKPIILILNEGRPRIVREEADQAKAVVNVLLPGNEGGNALADILFGDANPSGKLPFTYPAHVNDLVPYFYKYSETAPHADGSQYNDPFIKPQWPFGHGLSYTSFEYSSMTLNDSVYTAKDTIRVFVNILNTGDRSGKEVVQLYSSDLVASVTPSVRRLRAFRKLELGAGQSTIVTFLLPVSDLAFVNSQQDWIVESGQFELEIGGERVSFILSETALVSKHTNWRL